MADDDEAILPASGRWALVHGEPLHNLPKDLYIPPDALEVFLETFEGPLDLLLYLIRRRNLDILDIPLIEITNQYMEYVELMKTHKLELAAEYLVMAAMLCELKSRMLLPRAQDSLDDEDDPRAELVRRLLEYERFKLAALALDALPRLERDHFLIRIEFPASAVPRAPVPVALPQVLDALRAVLRRAELFAAHQIERETLSLRERMSHLLERLEDGGFWSFVELLDPTEGRAGVVVTLLAVLELLRAHALELVQTAPFAPIRVRLCPPEQPSDGSGGAER